MEGQEVDQSGLIVKIIPKTQMDSDIQAQLLQLFKAGYGEDWLGDDTFRNVRIKNCTDALEISSNKQLAAAILFDNERIMQITVHPDFQGQGLGVRLLEEAVKQRPYAWISVAVDAESMLATVTSPELNFLPVNDEDKIEALLRDTNGSKDSFEVETKKVDIPLVSARLSPKGVDEQGLTAYAAKKGSTHGQAYYQILFQNKA